MMTVVSSPSATVYRQLADRRFRRGGLSHHAAPVGNELFELVRAKHPQVVILDAVEPGTFDMCRRIKEDPRLGETRVVLIVHSALTGEDVARLSRCGADGVLFQDAPTGDLYEQIARMLGLPRRRMDRAEVALSAELVVGEQTLQVRLRDLTILGAGFALDRKMALDRGTAVTVRLSRATDGTAVTLDARIAWMHPDDAAIATLWGVEFSRTDAEALRRLEDMMLWEMPRAEEGRPQVAIRGSITEVSDFSRLLSRLPAEVDFDLGAVQRFNSAGVRNWVEFLRKIPPSTNYRFVRCSVAFVAQLSMVPAMIGRGRVLSFFVPYRCDGCDRESDRLFQSEAFGPPPRTIPRFVCACGGTLVFDDLEDRYLSFLDQA